MWRALLAGLLLGGMVFADEAKEKPVKPGKVELSRDEKALVELLNKARAKEKQEPLKVNPLLCRVARAHSENMAKQEKMDHVLDGKRVKHRVTDAGYDYLLVAENLAMAEGGDDLPAADPAEIHKNWMESKDHCRHILNGRFTEIGISMVKSKKGNYYYTQVFARPDR